MKHQMNITGMAFGLFVGVVMISSPAWATNGHVLHGVGSVNQSMGGAGIATSIDAIGSNHNNTSSIAFLGKSSIEFGFELFAPDRSMGADTAVFGSTGSSGRVESKTREAVIPEMGVVLKMPGPLTFGLTALGIGGFGVDYRANAFVSGAGNSNPLAAPQSAGGFGAIYANYQLLQVTSSGAYRLTPKLSVGLGFNIDWASLSVNPWPATPPGGSSPGPGSTTYGYPTGTHAATAWGYGFTVGTTYLPISSLALGVSFKSPQWFNDFSWNSQYPDGSPTSFKFRLDYPMIIGSGVSYKPMTPLVLAADVKWINFSNTHGFEDKNFASTPAGPFVRGFGWEDIWTISFGAQYRVTPKFAIRSGYNYGQNPIPSEQQFFNVFAPAIVKHHLNVGAGYQFSPSIGLNIAYYHAFKEEETGPVISNGNAGLPPLNQPVPGTSVANELNENSVSLQLSYTF